MKIYDRFYTDTFDEEGRIADIRINCPDSFNFAYDVVDEIAKEEPERRAIVWLDKSGEERIFTFGELSELSNRAANLFLSRGIRKGDHVMLILKRHYQYWYALLGLHKIGAVAIPSTHMLKAHDIAYRIENADIKLILCTPEEGIPDSIREISDRYPGVIRMAVRGSLPDFLDFDAEMQKQPGTLSRIATDSHDPMLLYFTSGTTGEPKGVVHDHSYALGHVVTAKYWQCCVDGGLHLTLADTGWGKAAWGKLYGQWLSGSAVMVYDYDNFYANEILGIIEKYKVTTFCAPPTIYRYLVRARISGYDLSSLAHTVTAGEALSPDTQKDFLEKTGLLIHEGYGQTETTLTLANLQEDPVKPGSIGRPTPLFDMDILTPEGKSASPMEEGEIVMIPKKEQRMIGLFSCYHGDEEHYREVWEGGVYHTKDIAYRDEDGYYYFASRKDDVIKSSGYRIGPAEVESVLLNHEAVLECAVTGVPSRKRGFLIKATIVPTPGYEPSDELKADIRDFVMHEASSYKCPRVIEFAESLPKTANGKIRRDVIRNADKDRLYD
ncbi:MAG: AMP-binding protein [Lachnospiraceae bacterium]|nr:AMP-binding protein [Lachnospiraceae bacterium]